MTAGQSSKPRYVWTPAGPVLKAPKRKQLERMPANLGFAQALRDQRRSLGISQREAGRLAGVTVAMYSRYECAVSIPNADVLVALQRAGFGTDVLLQAMRGVA